MSDAIGGVFNIVLVIIFITVIALYMAFNINYQKAFNVKNKIISIYEAYDGVCDNKCKKEIENYEKTLGYNIAPSAPVSRYGSGTATISDKNNVCNSNLGYCVKGVEAKKNIEDTSIRSSYNGCYFEITTYVDIKMPFINKLLNIWGFPVTGQTKTIGKLKGDCGQIAKSNMK